MRDRKPIAVDKVRSGGAEADADQWLDACRYALNDAKTRTP